MVEIQLIVRFLLAFIFQEARASWSIAYDERTKVAAVGICLRARDPWLPEGATPLASTFEPTSPPPGAALECCDLARRWEFPHDFDHSGVHARRHHAP